MGTNGAVWLFGPNRQEAHQSHQSLKKKNLSLMKKQSARRFFFAGKSTRRFSSPIHDLPFSLDWEPWSHACRRGRRRYNQLPLVIPIPLRRWDLAALHEFASRRYPPHRSPGSQQRHNGCRLQVVAVPR